MRTPRRVPTSLLRYSPLAAALASALIPALAATYTVVTTADTGAGSLRAAMQTAISACDTNAVINFNIPAGPFVISPSASFPIVTNNCPPGPTPVRMTIDGTTQPGASVNSAATGFNAANVIEISGGSFSYGCAFQSADFGYGQGTLAIRGVKLHGFVSGTPICGVAEVTGSEIFNNSQGVNVTSPGFVGGPGAADRNIIGNNSSTGIAGQGSVTIENNYIGTNNAGTASAPNDVGISLFNASNSTIKNNLVSGNATVGISANNSSNLQITGNIVGADASKAIGLGNGMGMDLVCVAGSLVSSNLVSGNAYGGIYLSLSDGAQFLSNKIGVAGDGSSAMPNSGHGMHVAYGSFCGGLQMAKAALAGGSNGLTISGNTIASNAGKGLWLEAAGDATISGNTIRNNSIYGIMITAGTGNRITGNSIFANLDKNIDLGFYGGPLPNDETPPPPDSNRLGHPNEWQNHPNVLGVTQQVASNSTVVSWELYSIPNTTFPVEFYANSTAGVPAGQTHLAAPISATTNASGYFSTSTTLGGLHNNIAMLAIDPLGNTSEFSAAVSVTPTPEVVVSPPSPTTLTFPNTVAGASSSPQSVTLSSVGGAGYVINSFSTAPTCYGGPICSSGAFTCSVGCTTGTPYSAGSSCSISITFAPIATGPATDSFYICDNAPGSPRSVTLNGTAVPPPPPTVTPANQGFGTLQVGTVGSPLPFTFHNPAPVSVSVTGVTVTGPYQMTHNCLSSLPAGGNCTANVSFAPTAPGAGSGALALVASSGTASATLSGTGSAIPPATIAPASADFGLVVVNSVSAPQAFTINNPAATSIPLSSFNVTPPFALLSTTCTSSMPPNSSCVANVKFAPTAVGPASGSISTTAGAAALSASLTGTGAATPALSIAPTGFDFGQVPVGSAADGRFVLTNPSATSTTLSTPLVNPPFSVAATTCSATLAPQETCAVVVRFTPFAGGPTSGLLTVPSSAGNATATLIGDGVLQAILTLSGSSIDLGTLTLNAPAGSATLSIGNGGNAPMRIQGITLAPPFTLTHACPAILQPGESCTLTVGLNPTELGTFTASLALLTDAPGGSRSVPVTAAVEPSPEPRLRVTPTFIGFGARLGATASLPQQITVFNEGGAEATGLALTIALPHFAVLNSRCGPTLAPRSSCFAEVVFQPTGFGPKSGQLEVTSTNAPTAVVNLSGASCRPPQPGGSRGPSGLNCGP